MPNSIPPDKKYALIVGINTYPGILELRGCINDAKLMATILQNDYEFPAQNIRLLLDDEATGRSILNSVDLMIGQVQLEGVAFIHFSGHARQIVRAGTENAATLVPFPDGAFDSDQDFMGQELHARLTKLTNACKHVVLVFDTDHAGGLLHGWAEQNAQREHFVLLGATGANEVALGIPLQ